MTLRDSLQSRPVQDDNFEMGRVASRTFGTIGRNWVSFFALAVIAVAPQVLLAAYLGVGAMRGKAIDPTHLGHYFGTMGIASLASLVLGSVLQAALVHGTIADLNGKKASFGDCLQTGLRTCLPVIGLSILFGIALVVGLVLLVVPGVLMFLAWAVIVPVLVVEKTGVFGAFGRSAELTRGHRWAILGLVIVVGLISMILGFATLPFQSALAQPGAGFAAMAPAMLIQGIVNVISTTIGATGTASVYYELRSIKEGIGPEQLASVFD
jgi:hypothetical protein